MTISTETWIIRPSKRAGSTVCYDPATRLHVEVAIVPHTHFRLSIIRLSTARIAAVLLAVLLPALLTAQWAGLQHRVAHAWIAAAADHAAADSDSGDTLHLAHSCALFDAATLGVTLQSAFFLPTCLRARLADARLAESTPGLAHAFRHFLPRAPPAP